jgi:hypothetical protein
MHKRTILTCARTTGQSPYLAPMIGDPACSSTIRRIMPRDGKADGRASHEQKGGFRSPGPHHDRRQVYRGHTGRQRCSAGLRVPSAPRACHERSFPARKVCDVASCHLRTGETFALTSRWGPSVTGRPDRVAIFYRQDGERIPDPGLIVVGKIKAGMEAFAVLGAIKATIERS